MRDSAQLVGLPRGGFPSRVCNNLDQLSRASTRGKNSALPGHAAHEMSPGVLQRWAVTYACEHERSVRGPALALAGGSPSLRPSDNQRTARPAPCGATTTPGVA